MEIIHEDPETHLNWLIRLDAVKKILIVRSADKKYHWVRKIGNNQPIDAFLVKGNVFLTWERPEQGHYRLQELSIISAHDLNSGKLLWEWDDYILTVMPFQNHIFIIIYRDEYAKGFIIKAEARSGKVLWKVASEEPIVSWDIDIERTILRDSAGRVYILQTKDGTIKK